MPTTLTLKNIPDAVYERLRPATRERAEKVAQGGGFGILIQ